MVSTDCLDVQIVIGFILVVILGLELCWGGIFEELCGTIRHPRMTRSISIQKGLLIV